MKRLVLLFIAAFLLSPAMPAQAVLNGGFENWTNGIPDNWNANNGMFSIIPITQSLTAHTGSYSVKGTVIPSFNSPMGPVLRSGTNLEGFVISQRYKTVTGYYQFSPQQGDRLELDYFLYKGASITGSVTLYITAPANSWTEFSADIIYRTNDIPDKILISFMILGPTDLGIDYHQGSYFLLDDADLTGTATSIIDKNIIPAKFSLEQNFPNPFNPSTKINYSLAADSKVTLEVYNISGERVSQLVNKEQTAGNYSVEFGSSGLPSGVYLYRINALGKATGNNFSSIKKMILLK